MDIIITKNKKQMTVTLNGKLDTMTAPALEEKLSDGLDGIEKLIFDFTELKYISSAGLRAVKNLYLKVRGNGGELTIINASPRVADVFEMTGFAEMLNLK